MFKRRSAHGSASKQLTNISGPSNFVKMSGMGSVGTAGPDAANSVIYNPQHSSHIDSPDEGAVGEPLVQDIRQVEEDPILPSKQREPPLTPPSKATDFDPLGSNPPAGPSDEEPAPPPPDFTRRGIHVPTRTSSSSKSASKARRFFRSSSGPPSTMGTPSKPYSRPVSSADSVISYESSTSSIATQNLVPLQQRGALEDNERLSPLLEDDPKSFDLLASSELDSGKNGFSLEAHSELLFSKEHLEAIFRDTPSLLRFTAFLSAARPSSVPVLIYYLDALKAIKAINYANAVAEALEPIEGHEFTENTARPTVNAILEERARQAFDVLVRNELPAFITHIMIQLVSVSIQKRVTGNLPPLLREASEGLAEVFCLTDPSRTDNPIIFASEEFHRTTQYGVSYAIGRNCRFLQGPRTNRYSVARLKAACEAGKEVNELFLNYRRDGSPFMNLLMLAPLLDSRGILRYFIGAQVDVSGLVKEPAGLDAFQQLLDKQEGKMPEEDPKDEFQELSEMFNNAELETVRKFGGNMHREHVEDDRDDASMQHRPRLLIKDPSNGDIETSIASPSKPDGRLSGVYKHYLLIRPHPSLRILFTSPSLRVPGILQSRFLDRIGGSTRVRDSVAEALADGTRGVTAKIRWLSAAASSLDGNRSEEGRPRWIHCTPLLGQSGAVGVWMVVLVDDEKSSAPIRRFRQAPPVAHDVRRGTRNSSPLSGRRVDLSSDEMESRTPRNHSRNGLSEQPPYGALQRPRSILSDQRAYRAGSPQPGREPSVSSFALN